MSLIATESTSPKPRRALLRGVAGASLSLGLTGGLAGWALLDGARADEGPNSSLYSQRVSELRPSAPLGMPAVLKAQQLGQMPMPPGAASPGAASPGAASPGAAPSNLSWYEIPLPPTKEVRVNDIITIRVDTGARTSEMAQMQRRRTAQYDAKLNDWIVLEGLRAIKPAPQSEGDQTIQGNLQQLNRVTSQLDTADSLKFEIAATIAAVLPNGNVVLEAHRVIRSNNEQWMHSLSGVCRREDIGPNNVVLSKDIANLQVDKRELGQIRDAYKRGWLSRWWDQFGPF
jgi:flagellar L-ring protein precursor FlgH